MQYVKDAHDNYVKKVKQEGQEHSKAREHEKEIQEQHIPNPHLAPAPFDTQAAFQTMMAKIASFQIVVFERLDGLEGRMDRMEKRDDGGAYV